MPSGEPAHPQEPVQPQPCALGKGPTRCGERPGSGAPPRVPLVSGGTLPTALQGPKFSWSIFGLTGSKYWAFSGGQMVQGYPKDIYHSLGFPQMVKKIDAATHEDKTGKTYFFVGNEYWS